MGRKTLVKVVKLFGFEKRRFLSFFQGSSFSRFEKSEEIEIMGKDESIPDMVLRKIFDKNPLLEFVDRGKYEEQPARKDLSFWNPKSKNWIGGNYLDDKNVTGRKIELDAHWIFTFPSFLMPSGITDEVFNHIGDRAFNVCMEIEKSALGCVEYYGAKRGLTICADHYDDFYECIARDKQFLRAQAMVAKRRMRYREYLAGNVITTQSTFHCLQTVYGQI